MKEKPKVNVCVCTYLRLNTLEECLASLVDQSNLNDFTYSITVIDNDSNQSAKAIVSKFQKQCKVAVLYVCETSRGIPFARNRALDESLQLGSDYIVFIDDDEAASRDWLSALYANVCSYADPVIIHGQVIAKFPENTPQYMRDLYRTKKKRSTGTRLKTCATDNVIFPVNILKKFELRFDTSVPLAGGTDTKFFLEFSERGIPIYECAEAVVFETVFSSRLNLSWIMNRKYRSGITTAWRRLYLGHFRLGLISTSISSFFLHIISYCLFFVFLQRTLQKRQLLKAARSMGVLAGAFGLKSCSYAIIDR